VAALAGTGGTRQVPDAFHGRWLREIMQDSFGFAGCEAARRVIGLAKVSDLETWTRRLPVAGTAMLGFSRTLLIDGTR